MGAQVRREVGYGEAELDGRQVLYRVVRSPRAVHIRLRMMGDGTVEIVVPPRIPVPSIEGVLESKRRWIHRQLDRIGALPTIPTNRVSFLGNEYPVVVTRRGGHSGQITRTEHEIRIMLPDDGEASPVVEAFLRRQARHILHERVRTWAETMQVRYGRISVRDQRTRWGSCSSNGTLSFSWRLVMAPLPVLEYVVIHELMHLREMNHGRAFWDGVGHFCPAYEQHRAWLKANGAVLARPVTVEGTEVS